MLFSHLEVALSTERFFPRWLSMSVNLGLILFVVARAAAVWGALDQYGVNPWVFLFLDIVTVPPYVWGLAQMIRYFARDASVWRFAAGTVSAVIGFAAPYIYTYAVGYQTIPTFTKITIGVIIGIFFMAGPVNALVRRRHQ